MPFSLRSGAAVLLSSCCALAADFQRGVNFTAEFPGGYSSPAALEMVRKLPAYGVDAIALVPYAFMPDKSSPRVLIPALRHSLEGEDGIREIAAAAHQLGMKVLLKPQIWLRGSYPGDISFPSDEVAKAWFEEYERFIDHEASLAATIHAEVFCIGVEFGKLIGFEAEWRSLIARTRLRYNGELVYAANSGPEFESLRFWDALDYIGLNEYYPLPDDLSAAAIVRKVETVQRRFHKPVIFTEAGFSSTEAPQRAPWDEMRGKLSPRDQARCYEAVLRAFYKEPWFHGVYWWKVGSNGFGGLDDGSHTPWGKPAMEVLRRWYLHGGR